MNTDSTLKILENMLESRLDAEQWTWLQERRKLVNSEQSERDLHISLGLIPRKLGRADLSPSSAELEQAHQAVAGWHPAHWSIDTAARVLVLSTVATRSNQHFGKLFRKVCQTADLRETIALYEGVSLYPASDELDTQIGEGLRTSVRAVFEAIAHDNPYPQQHFEELRWNHMVLKALFIESTLHPIQGLDARANEELAHILCDYAHERWAASRPVTPELWRCVGPFAEGDMLEDLRRVFESGSSIERQAAAMALSSNQRQEAQTLLNSDAELSAAVVNAGITWDSIARELP